MAYYKDPDQVECPKCGSYACRGEGVREEGGHGVRGENWNAIYSVEVRNAVNTLEKCEAELDRFEQMMPHEELPDVYDWLIAKRDHLKRYGKESRRIR